MSRKDNGENIMKSINEGPFNMGTVSDVIAGGTEGAVQQGPIRARVLNDLSAKEKERYKADIRATNILLQEESQYSDEFEHFRQIKGETIHGYYVRFTKLINDMRNIKMTMPRMQLNSKFVNNMLPEWSRFHTEVKHNRAHGMIRSWVFLVAIALWYRVVQKKSSKIVQKGDQLSDTRRVALTARCLTSRRVVHTADDVDDSPENDLALNVDHIFEADQCDAFDSDVDEAPNVQTMFMVNLSSKDPIYDEAGPSHDSNTPFEVQDHDTCIDHMDKYHEVHEMQNDVQHNYIVDSNAEYTSKRKLTWR
ncbi:hypothetical protein Tco_0845662 [Tanacetum coccineum]